MRLLVTGCARSGNTLMQFLMASGFCGVDKIDGEVCPLSSPADGVFKYPRATFDLGRYAGRVAIIFMLRHPKAVLMSRKLHAPYDYWVSPERWIQATEMLGAYSDYVCMVRYESLVTQPDYVQGIPGRVFDLEISHPFSLCHEYFDEQDVGGVKLMRGIRSMDKTRLEPWRSASAEDLHHLRSCYENFPQLAELEARYYG